VTNFGERTRFSYCGIAANSDDRRSGTNYYRISDTACEYNIYGIKRARGFILKKSGGELSFQVEQFLTFSVLQREQTRDDGTNKAMVAKAKPSSSSYCQRTTGTVAAALFDVAFDDDASCASVIADNVIDRGRHATQLTASPDQLLSRSVHLDCNVRPQASRSNSAAKRHRKMDASTVSRRNVDSVEGGSSTLCARRGRFRLFDERSRRRNRGTIFGRRGSWRHRFDCREGSSQKKTTKLRLEAACPSDHSSRTTRRRRTRTRLDMCT